MLAYLNKIKLWIRNLLFCRSFNSLGIEFFFSLLFFWSRLKPSFTISIYLWMCMCVYLDSCNLACMLNWFQFIHVVILNAFLVCRPLSSRLKLFSFFFFGYQNFVNRFSLIQVVWRFIVCILLMLLLSSYACMIM